MIRRKSKSVNIPNIFVALGAYLLLALNNIHKISSIFAILSLSAFLKCRISCVFETWPGGHRGKESKDALSDALQSDRAIVSRTRHCQGLGVLLPRGRLWAEPVDSSFRAG